MQDARPASHLALLPACAPEDQPPLAHSIAPSPKQGRAADAAGIQFRMLNASKGPAVRGPRAQMDRLLYKREMQRLMAGVSNLQVHDGAVVDLLVEQRPSSSSGGSSLGGDSRPAVAGVVLASGERILCRSVVITTGTFLRGVIHIGSHSRPAGRIASLVSARAAAGSEGAVRAAEQTDQADEQAAGAATQLAQRFAGLGFGLGRLKTGTPPRLDGEQPLWSCCEPARLPALLLARPSSSVPILPRLLLPSVQAAR